MRIAFISQPLDRVAPPSMNSIGIWTYEMARRLAKTHNVTVYARGGISKLQGIGENVDTRFVRSIPSRYMSQISRIPDRRSTPNRPFFSSVLYNLEYSLQIALDIMRRKIEVVHIQNYSQFVPVIRAFNPKVKIALHMRCEWLTQLDQAMIAPRLEKTDLIFGVSDYITNLIRDTYPKHSRKCFTVANGVDINVFKGPKSSLNGPQSGQRTLLTVGRISPEKGIHVLLEAFHSVADRFPDVCLELVGPIGSVNKEYIVGLSEDTQVNALGIYYERDYWEILQSLIPPDIKDRIVFKGGVSFYSTVNFYQHSAILVNPSLSESFGRSLIEANACEVPIVAAKTGGMVEIIEQGYNGLIVEPGNASELANAMIQLLSDEPRRKQMGLNGRQRVLERYTWDQICNDLINAYHCSPSTEKPAGHLINSDNS